MFQLNKVLQLLVVRLGSAFAKGDQVHALRLLAKISRSISILAQRLLDIYNTDPIIRQQIAALSQGRDEFIEFASSRVPFSALAEKAMQVAHETGLDGHLHLVAIMPVTGVVMAEPPQQPARPVSDPTARPLGKYILGRHNLN